MPQVLPGEGLQPRVPLNKLAGQFYVPMPRNVPVGNDAVVVRHHAGDKGDATSRAVTVDEEVGQFSRKTLIEYVYLHNPGHAPSPALPHRTPTVSALSQPIRRQFWNTFGNRPAKLKKLNKHLE